MSHAVVKVILKSKEAIESPILPQEEAEEAIGEISAARIESREIVLSWLSLNGNDVEAAHLEDRAAPTTSARERLG